MMATPPPGAVSGTPLSVPLAHDGGPNGPGVLPAQMQPAPAARRARRWQIGLAGLGGVMLLVALSSMVAGPRGVDPATVAGDAEKSAAGNAGGDPLTDLGVLPDEPSAAAGESTARAIGAVGTGRSTPIARPEGARDAAAADSAVIDARAEPIVPDLEGPDEPSRR